MIRAHCKQFFYVDGFDFWEEVSLAYEFVGKSYYSSKSYIWNSILIKFPSLLMKTHIGQPSSLAKHCFIFQSTAQPQPSFIGKFAFWF